MITQGGSGPGGQHQNKRDSAVRATHIPTGIQVFINGRCQHENRRVAMRVLAQRVHSLKVEQAHQEHNSFRQKQVQGGGRSGKVRTYNFMESRVTDHQSGKKTKQIKQVMRGSFDLVA